jgi:predicted ester cyclase
LLHFTAAHILGNPGKAETAVRNTLRVASQHPASFESESAFRSWVLRVLIEQSLLLFDPQPASTDPATAVDLSRCFVSAGSGSKERRRNVIANKSVVCAFVEEVINQGRFDRADDLIAPSFVGFDPLPGQRWKDRDGFKEILRRMRAGFPDLRWIVEEMVAEGDLVVSRFICSGTHHGSFLGLAATGRKIRFTGMAIDRVIAGKLADSRILIDRLKLMQQLGAFPTR